MLSFPLKIPVIQYSGLSKYCLKWASSRSIWVDSSKNARTIAIKESYWTLNIFIRAVNSMIWIILLRNPNELLKKEEKTTIPLEVEAIMPDDFAIIEAAAMVPFTAPSNLT